MTPKERVLKTIKHEEPDRVPVANTLAKEAARLLSTDLNMPYHQVVRWSWNEILAALGNDVIFVGATPPADFSAPVGLGDILLVSGLLELHSVLREYVRGNDRRIVFQQAK